jgi:hypothetical protein
MNALYHELFRAIERYRSYPNVEIEARLGWKKGSYFDTNIQIEFFEVLKKKLNSAHSMIERHEATDVHIVDKCRVIVCDGKVKEVHKKIKLFEVDLGLEGSPYDVRLSVCQERPIENKISKLTNNSLIRSRQRHQFLYKMFNYDLTEVLIHATNSHVYEFELELNLHNVCRKTHGSHYLAHSMAMKIEDIVKFSVDDCENIHLKNVTYI